MKNRIIQLLFLLILLTFYSCSRVSKNIHISDFKASIKDSLMPKSYGSYSSYIITIKGHINDSSYIKPCETCNKFFINGELINEKFIFDYYGEIKNVFEFIPFKATEGELDIEISIQ